MNTLFQSSTPAPCPKCGTARRFWFCAPHCFNFFCERDSNLDLAPHSDEYCEAHGIKPAREDFAANEMIELPAPEFRRNVLVAAAEMVFK